MSVSVEYHFVYRAITAKRGCQCYTETQIDFVECCRMYLLILNSIEISLLPLPT